MSVRRKSRKSFHIYARSKIPAISRLEVFNVKSPQCNLNFKPRVMFRVAFHSICFGLFVAKLVERSKRYQSQTMEKSRVQTQDEIEKHLFEALSYQELPSISNSEIGHVSDATMDMRRILSLPPSRRGFSDQKLLTKHLKRINSIQQFPADVQQKLHLVLQYETFEPGRVIVKEGHPSSAAYFIWEGSVIVNKNVKDFRNGTMFNLTVKVLTAGDSFGTREVLQEAKRENTIISRTSVGLLSINKKDFHRVLGVSLTKQAEEASCYVLSLPQFKVFPMLTFLLSPQSLYTSYYSFNNIVATYSELHSSKEVVVVRQGRCKILIHYAAPSNCTERVSKTMKSGLPLITGRKKASETKLGKSKRKRFFEIGIVEEGECFGLQLIFNKALCTIALVSMGAECISISKEFFVQEASPQLKKSLTSTSGYYPDKKILDAGLYRQKQWVKYKETIIQQIFASKS